MQKATAKNPTASFIASLKDWQAVSLIAAAVFFFFRNILLQKAFLWEDFLYYFYPTRNFAAVSLAGGELPLWNPYTFNGMPFLADIQTAVFYIPNLLLTFFVTDSRLPPFWLELSIIIHYVVAGAGMYYLAKSYDLENVFALFAGLVFALCGFMVGHAIHQVVINEVAWLPLVILLFRKTLKQRSLLKMILTGLVLGHSVLAGFPQLTLYIFFFLFLIFLFEFYAAVKSETLARAVEYLPFAAGAIIIAVALTAIQLLPTLELAPLSQRAQITYEQSLESSMEWRQLITLFVPHFFGSHGAQGSTFWLSNGYSHYWETCFYLGVAPLVFLVFAARQIRSNRTIAFLFGIGAFSLLYALGDGFILHRLFFMFVPGFDQFRAIGRMTLLLSVAGSLLAAFGMRTMITLAANQTLWRKYLIAIAAAAGLFWIAVQMGFLQPDGQTAAEQSIQHIASLATTTSIIILVAVCGLAFLHLRGFFSLSVFVVLIIATQIIDMNIFGFDQNNGSVNPVDYFNRTASLVNYLKEDGKRELFRVNSRQGGNMILDRNQGMIDRVFLMEGYTPLVLQRAYPPAINNDVLCDLMNVKYRIAVDEQRRTLSLARVEKYLPRMFMVYSTRTFTSEDTLKAFMESEQFDPRNIAAIEQDPPVSCDTVVAPQDWSARIISYQLNQISAEVSTPTTGLLILDEIYYPGWNAYVDGVKETVFRADWNQRAIALSAGSHHVLVRFEPESFQRGTVVTLTTIGLSMAGIAFSVFRSRRKQREKG